MVNSIKKGNLILAIESAIRGGSISLLREGTPIAGTAGDDSVSRAEDLILQIDDLLQRTGTRKSDLASIAVSNGPGSFTGLRIGLATAMGLSMALGIPCTGVPLFDAIAEGSGSSLAVVAPIGRSDLSFRLFEDGTPQGDYLVGGIDEFVSFVSEGRPERIAHHPDIDISQIETLYPEIALTEVRSNLAEYLGRYAATHPGSGSLEPIYVRNPRFA